MSRKNLLQITAQEYNTLPVDLIPLVETILLDGIRYTHTSIIYDGDGKSCELLTAFTISVPDGEIVGAVIAYDRNDTIFLKLMMMGIYPLWSVPKSVWDTMDEFLALETVSEEVPTIHGDEYLLLTSEI